MEKTLPIIALASLAFASVTLGQTPPPGIDRVGLYSGQFDGPTWANITPANPGPHPVYLIAHGISRGGIAGFELKVHINGPAGSYNLLGTTLFGEDPLNAVPHPYGLYDFYVGFGAPMITPTGGQGTYVLARMNFLILTMEPITLRIGKAEYYRGDWPEGPFYVGPDTTLELLTPSSGSVAAPVFGFNTGPLDPPIAVEDETWGGVKGMFR